MKKFIEMMRRFFASVFFREVKKQVKKRILNYSEWLYQKRGFYYGDRENDHRLSSKNHYNHDSDYNQYCKYIKQLN